MREDVQKKRGSGFTLVEVLIAVAILAVVSIPVLQSFVSVAQVNGKSRRRLAATTIAENIMESCKGTSLLEVAAQCNSLAPMTIVSDPGTTTFTGTAQELYPSGTSWSDTGTEAKTVSYDSGYKFNKKDKCAFWIRNIKSGGAKYDVVLEYEYQGGRSHASDSDVTSMGTNGVNLMSFYKVTVSVYRSASEFGLLTNPIVTIDGSVADYSK